MHGHLASVGLLVVLLGTSSIVCSATGASRDIHKAESWPADRTIRSNAPFPTVPPPASTSPPATRGAERGSESPTAIPPQTGIPPATVTQQSAEEFNCLAEWLRISGATADEVITLPASSAVVESALDEESITQYRPFFLALILKYNNKLAISLQTCVARTGVCPAASIGMEYPCSDTGRCLFNSTSRRTACRCPAGLQGERCATDVNECEDKLLNNCDSVVVATCLNVHGSYGCVCRQGYEGTGQDCSDIDECVTSAHDCSQEATCRNTNGSYICHSADSCSGSRNLELCREIQQVRLHNENLEQKLAERDGQIQKLMSNMKLIAGLITDSHHKTDQLTAHMRRKNNQLREKLETATSILTADISQTKAEISQTKADIEAKINQTKVEIKAEALQTKSVQDARMNLIAKTTESKLQNKCGVVSWKSFSQFPMQQKALSWSVVFNKTRPDTVLRFVYTSYFGQFVHSHSRQYSTSLDYCYKVSILINGTQCANPGPITGGSTYRKSLGDGILSNPGAISGVCNIATKGVVQLSTQLVGGCNYGSRDKYDGYYGGTGSVTSTLHVEELLEC